MSEPPRIDADLVRRLVAAQFPQWVHLPIEPIAVQGWNNKAFHLGPDLLVRLPRAQPYVAQVQKEQAWLPRLRAAACAFTRSGCKLNVPWFPIAIRPESWPRG